MARITLFWCFWTKIFLSGMMELQVKFCHLSWLRLWRTGMLFSTKSKDHKSNFRISGMYRYRFYDLKVQFWWPNKCSKHQVLRLNTLYTLKCSQLISSSDNKKILLTTRNVRLDSGRYATKYYSNVTTEVMLMGIEKDGAYIAGEAPTVSSGKLAVAASNR